jgi:hypothetical protein
MIEERNESFLVNSRILGHVKSIFLKLMKKNQVEENGNGTRNGIAGTVMYFLLMSQKRRLTLRFGSEIALHRAMTMGFLTSAKLFQRK